MKVKSFVTDGIGAMREVPVFSTECDVPGAVNIELTDETVTDDFEGFGVALTGSSCYLLQKTDTAKRNELLHSIYGKDGMNLSVARLTVGASDYSAELYSYDDRKNDTSLSSFSIKKDEEYVIPSISEVIAVNPDIKLYASPWSPPGWMKTGGAICGGYMREQFIDIYADYFVRYIESYKEKGINISAVTPQNECETSQSGKMPACIWHPDTEAKFILTLRRKLDEKKLDTAIWALDHNFDLKDRVLWQLEEYPELEKALEGVAFHYYSGSIEMLRGLRKKYPSLRLHFTEGGPRLYDNYAVDWCKWGNMLSKVLNEGLKSFCGWNLLLDETGGPNIGPFFCGGLVTINSQSGELSYSGQYKALSHFSRFIRKGAKIKRVSTESNGMVMFGYPNAVPELSSVVFAENTDGGKVLIITNGNKQKRQYTVTVDGVRYYIEALPDTVQTIVFR